MSSQRFSFKAFALAYGSLLFALIGSASAQTYLSNPNGPPPFQSNPVINFASATPLVMLNMSKDQLLFFRAYNDFTELDPTGHPTVVQTTYADYIQYYGYFDSEKCYAYAAGLFTATGKVNGYVDTIHNPTDHKCSGKWSGNFLNWATMTRMDSVRKLLYGGYRSTDTNTSTILERAQLPTDGHAFAKFYNGTDLSSFVPFTTGSDFVNTPITTVASFTASPIPTTSTTISVTVTSTTGIQIGDQLCLYYPATATPVPCTTNIDGTLNLPTLPADITGTTSSGFIVGGVNSIDSATTLTLTTFAGSSSTTALGATICKTTAKCNFQVVDLSSPGISICNVSDPGITGGLLSQTVSTPPLMRVVKGNHQLWAANEQLQCLWFAEKSNSQGGTSRSNGNRAFFSGLAGSSENSDQTKVAIGSGSVDPVSGSAAGTFYVRVTACPGALDVDENCEKYPLGNEKPIGLLQTYGESGRIKFGLITGSYDKNISGGVVRKNLPPSTVNGTNSLTDEISSNIVSGDGTFLTPGATGGIIATLNSLRAYGYKFETGDSWGDGDNCPYQLTSIVHSGATSVQRNEGNCTAWGDPLSQGYLESIRYLAGLAPTPNYQYTNSGSSHDKVLGLPLPAWPATTAPVVDNTNYCASMNVLNFNTSVSSYDSWIRDSAYYSTFTDIHLTPTNGTFPTGSGPNGWTKLVGDLEGITGGKYFIGISGAATDQMCSAKTVGDLSQISGLCPEAPAKQGSYLMAGIAYAAHTQRIRNDLTAIPTTDTSSLKVTTFGLQLASGTPTISIPKGDGTKAIAYTLLPAYRLDLGGGTFGGGTLVDFRVVHQDPYTTVCTATVPCTGAFYVNFEDSGQGGDFDQDMWGILSYKLTPTGLSVYTQVIGLSSTNGQGFGYIVSGSTADGPHFHSGGYAFNYTDPTPIIVTNDAGVAATTVNASGGCNGCNLGDVRTHANYTKGNATANPLNDPMWYAAKYGAFSDDPVTPTGKPDVLSKWDAVNNSDGSPGTDGVPDDYFLVTNPNQLLVALNRAFTQIIQKVSSGTAASVAASAGEGTGAVYQAFYEPARQETASPFRNVQWIGSLQALFVNNNGLFYENDGSTANACCVGNTPVRFTFDAVANQTKFFELATTAPFAPTGPAKDLSTLKPIWNARKILAAGTTPTTQRTYASTDPSSRYILTWIDANHDGVVGSGETTSFCYGGSGCTGGFGTSTEPYLNLLSSTAATRTAEAKNIVNWVRGQDGVNQRNRTMTYSASDGANQTQKLGDIINSTPTVVGTPAQSYDLVYGDKTYGDYREYYCDRRQVVLVGANDGMLHAFNGGFYDLQDQSFHLQPNTNIASCHTGTGGPGSSRTNFALGEELWGYVPQNLIGELTWMTDPAYKHIYYVDGTPRIFDVRLSSTFASHTVSNWGTIAVVPFRLGGGRITLNDGSTSPASTIATYHSGYIVLDITDPEKPPVVLTEITLPANQYATSSPTVVPIQGSWFLVVGSGPDVRTSVSSDLTANMYVYDLNKLTTLKYDSVGVTIPTATFPITSATNSFVGDLIASDWDLDYSVDGIYFGTQQTATGNTFNGGVYKLQTHAPGPGNLPDPTLSAWKMFSMYALPAGQPVSASPTLGIDENATPYVYVGTGRLLSATDVSTISQQAIYALKDNSETPNHPLDANCFGGSCVTVSASKLQDVTTAQVTVAGAVTGAGAPNNFKALLAQLGTNCIDAGAGIPSTCFDGWTLKLNVPTGANASTFGSERVVNSQSLFAGELFTTTYVPNNTLCGGAGLSSLYALDYRTGTGSPNNAVLNPAGDTGTTPVITSTTLGSGLASAPSLIVTPSPNSSTTPSTSKLQGCVQTSTGQVVCVNLGTDVNGEASWREVHNN